MRVRKLVKTRGGSDNFGGGCFGRGSLPHARLRHSQQLVQHLVLHKCCLKITFRDFSPPSVIEIPRDFFVDARNCIPRVCVKISSQKNQKWTHHFEKKLIFRAHCHEFSLIPNWGPRPTHTAECHALGFLSDTHGDAMLVKATLRHKFYSVKASFVL